MDANITSEDSVGSDAIVASGSVRVGGYTVSRNQHQTPDAAWWGAVFFVFPHFGFLDRGVWGRLGLSSTLGICFSTDIEGTQWVYVGWRICGIMSGDRGVRLVLWAELFRG